MSAPAAARGNVDVPADVISPPTEPPGKPGQYAFNVTLGAATTSRTITICLATASPPQCVSFVIGTTQQIGQDVRQVIGPQAVAAITTPTQQSATSRSTSTTGA